MMDENDRLKTPSGAEVDDERMSKGYATLWSRRSIPLRFYPSKTLSFGRSCVCCH